MYVRFVRGETIIPSPRWTQISGEIDLREEARRISIGRHLQVYYSENGVWIRYWYRTILTVMFKGTKIV